MTASVQENKSKQVKNESFFNMDKNKNNEQKFGIMLP